MKGLILIMVMLFYLPFCITGQVEIHTFQLKWSNERSEVWLSEDKNLSVLHFEGANYGTHNLSLPYFTHQFRLNSYASITVELEDVQFEPFDTSNLDLNGIVQNIKIEKDVAFQRKKAIGHLQLLPFRINPENGIYERILSGKIRISVEPKTYNHAFKRSNITTSKLANGQLYKFSVDRSGLHRIDHQWLLDAGIDPGAIDPRKIQILGNGGSPLPESMSVEQIDDLLENAILIEGEDDGRFDLGDQIIFYARGTKNWVYDSASTDMKYKHVNNPYSDQAFYYLKLADQNGKRVIASNFAGSGSYITNSYDALLHHEIDELNLLEMEFAHPPSGREWFGESFKNTRTRSFNFEFINRIESEPVQIATDLACRIFSPGTAQLTINGINCTPSINLPVTTLYLYTDYAKKFNFNSCNNNLYNGQLLNANINFNHSNYAADMWLNYFSVKARCELNFTSGQFVFRDANTLDFPDASYVLNTTKTITIWDITYPDEILNVASGSGQLNFSRPTETLHEFVAFDGSAYHTPQFEATVDNQNLHGITTPAEVVYVYHASLRSEVERLAEHRRNFNNVEVDIIDVEEIYNEFSSGIPDVTAIRNFCRMMYERETPSAPFKHLLLFGIGTFDYKSIGRPAENNPNLIPVYQTEESLHPISTYTSDDYFAILDTSESMEALSYLDVSVGRLPAANISEAKILVDKIIHYETNANTFSDWKNRICFVADDEDNNLHINDAEGIIGLASVRDSVYNTEKIYLDAFQQISTSGGDRYPQAHRALMDGIYKGLFVVNFLGHGGDDGWTQERVFTSTDISGMDNLDKLPLFITATCTFAPHDDPNIFSAGEMLMLNPLGGAISLLTTVRVVIAVHNELLVRNTFNIMFNKHPDGTPLTTGETLLQAKNNAAINPPTNSRKYALLGDPSMRLAFPRFKVLTDSILTNATGPSDTLSALDKVRVVGRIVDEQGNPMPDFNGILYPTVYDKEDRLFTLANDSKSFVEDFNMRKKVIFKGKASINQGLFSFEFVVPKDINYTYGEGKIQYYAEKAPLVDANGHYYNFIVGGSNVSAGEDNNPPVVNVYMNDENFIRGGATDEDPVLLVDLSDENGINTVGNSIGHDLVAVLTKPDLSTIEFVLNDFYESALDDHTSGLVNYPLNDLEEGPHSVLVTAWDVYNNKGTGSTEFIVAKSTKMALEHIFNYPNPFSTSTLFQFEHNQPFQDLDIQIQIYTVSGKLVKTIDHYVSASDNQGFRISDIHWDGKDDFNEKLANGVYVYKVQVKSSGEVNSSKYHSEFQKLVILK